MPRDQRTLPGDPLIKGSDPGGLRWFLNSEPIHAGTTLELALEAKTVMCDPCDGQGTDYDGQQDAEGLYPSCAACGGSGQLVSVITWQPVRLEFDHGREVALAYFPVVGASEMHAVVTDGARFRQVSR